MKRRTRMGTRKLGRRGLEKHGVENSDKKGGERGRKRRMRWRRIKEHKKNKSCYNPHQIINSHHEKEKLQKGMASWNHVVMSQQNISSSMTWLEEGKRADHNGRSKVMDEVNLENTFIRLNVDGHEALRTLPLMVAWGTWHVTVAFNAECKTAGRGFNSDVM